MLPYIRQDGRPGFHILTCYCTFKRTVSRDGSGLYNWNQYVLWH